MTYIVPSELQKECEDLIDKICATLITQEKYTLEVSGFAEGKGATFEKRRPNWEAVSHAHPALSINYATNMGFLVTFNQKFIGKINYWKNEEKHYITNSYRIDPGEEFKSISMNTIISVKSLLLQIVEDSVPQIRRLEKVLFCFET